MTDKIHCFNERTWQDIMIENKTKEDWTREAMNSGIVYCGRLCEVILKLEQQNQKMKEALERACYCDEWWLEYSTICDCCEILEQINTETTTNGSDTVTELNNHTNK